MSDLNSPTLRSEQVISVGKAHALIRRLSAENAKQDSAQGLGRPNTASQTPTHPSSFSTTTQTRDTTLRRPRPASASSASSQSSASPYFASLATHSPYGERVSSILHPEGHQKLPQITATTLPPFALAARLGIEPALSVSPHPLFPTSTPISNHFTPSLQRTSTGSRTDSTNPYRLPRRPSIPATSTPSPSYLQNATGAGSSLSLEARALPPSTQAQNPSSNALPRLHTTSRIQASIPTTPPLSSTNHDTNTSTSNYIKHSPSSLVTSTNALNAPLVTETTKPGNPLVASSHHFTLASSFLETPRPHDAPQPIAIQRQQHALRPTQQSHQPKPPQHQQHQQPQQHPSVHSAGTQGHGSRAQQRPRSAHQIGLFHRQYMQSGHDNLALSSLNSIIGENLSEHTNEFIVVESKTGDNDDDEVRKIVSSRRRADDNDLLSLVDDAWSEPTPQTSRPVLPPDIVDNSVTDNTNHTPKHNDNSKRRDVDVPDSQHEVKDHPSNTKAIPLKPEPHDVIVNDDDDLFDLSSALNPQAKSSTSTPQSHAPSPPISSTHPTSTVQYQDEQKILPATSTVPASSPDSSPTLHNMMTTSLQPKSKQKVNLQTVTQGIAIGMYRLHRLRETFEKWRRWTKRELEERLEAEKKRQRDEKRQRLLEAVKAGKMGSGNQPPESETAKGNNGAKLNGVGMRRMTKRRSSNHGAEPSLVRHTSGIVGGNILNETATGGETTLTGGKQGSTQNTPLRKDRPHPSPTIDSSGIEKHPSHGTDRSGEHKETSTAIHTRSPITTSASTTSLHSKQTKAPTNLIKPAPLSHRHPANMVSPTGTIHSSITNDLSGREKRGEGPIGDETRKNLPTTVDVLSEEEKAELLEAQTMLADQHYLRSTMFYFGWLPWMKLIEKRQRLQKEADASYHKVLLKAAFEAWKEERHNAIKRKEEHQIERETKAAAWHLKMLKRRAVRALRRHATACEGAEGRSIVWWGSATKKLVLTLWRNAVKAKEMRRKEREEKFREEIERQGKLNIQRWAMRLFKQCVSEEKKKKEEEMLRQATRNKVDGWIAEINQARQQIQQQEQNRSSLLPPSITTPSKPFLTSSPSVTLGHGTSSLDPYIPSVTSNHTHGRYKIGSHLLSKKVASTNDPTSTSSRDALLESDIPPLDGTLDSLAKKYLSADVLLSGLNKKSQSDRGDPSMPQPTDVTSHMPSVDPTASLLALNPSASPAVVAAATAALARANRAIKPEAHTVLHSMSAHSHLNQALLTSPTGHHVTEPGSGSPVAPSTDRDIADLDAERIEKGVESIRERMAKDGRVTEGRGDTGEKPLRDSTARTNTQRQGRSLYRPSS